MINQKRKKNKSNSQSVLTVIFHDEIRSPTKNIFIFELNYNDFDFFPNQKVQVIFKHINFGYSYGKEGIDTEHGNGNSLS